eukprot:6828835-Prymnesium_polylepis.1
MAFPGSDRDLRAQDPSWNCATTTVPSTQNTWCEAHILLPPLPSSLALTLARVRRLQAQIDTPIKCKRVLDDAGLGTKYDEHTPPFKLRMMAAR